MTSGPSLTPQALGSQAEQLARRHLERQGLRMVESNFRCRCGEIDLIMQDCEYLVFVEVRLRKSSGYGCAAETVSTGKQRRLIAAAELYLQRLQGGPPPCRFDVVAVTGGATPRLEWFRDAFQC